MGELAAATGRHVRAALRSRALVLFALLFAAALAGVLLGGGTLPVLAALITLWLIATGTAAAAGSALPADRETGRDEWLRTLAPPPWSQRLALVASGWGLAVVLAAVGAVLLAATVAIARPAYAVRVERDVPTPGTTLRLGPGDRMQIRLPRPPAPGETLELALRPRIEERLIDHVALAWRAGAVVREATVSVWEPARLDVSGMAGRQVEIVNADERLAVSIRGATLLGRPRAGPWVLAASGLLLGLMAAFAAPVAVLVSRGTSAATAVAAALCLLLVAAVHAPIAELSGLLAEEGSTGWPGFVLGAVTAVLPDLGAAALVGDLAAGRAPPGLGWAAFPGLLLHTLGATLLAALPFSDRVARRGGPA